MYELKYESHLFLKTSKLEEEKLSIIQALLKPARCICRKYAALRGVKGNSLDFFRWFLRSKLLKSVRNSKIKK